MRAFKLMMLPEKDSGLDKLFVRVHSSNLVKYGRRTPVIIYRNDDKKKRIIRYAVGAGSLKGVTKDTVAVDYDAIQTLGFKKHFNQECDLKVRKARAYEQVLFFARHPDISVRLSVRLGVLGAVQGFVGFVLGILPYFG